MDPRTDAPTTPLERAVRIGELIHGSGCNREALQAIVEIGAQELLAREGEIENLPAGATELAHQIFATFEPEVPEFEIRERVAREGVEIGRVADRYLNERGEWEYHVRTHGGFGTNPYSEKDLETVNGSVA